MVIVALLCFTFSGVSTMWGAEFETKDGKFRVDLDTANNFSNIQKPDTGKFTNEKDIKDLTIKVKGDDTEYVLKNIPAGTWIVTGPGDTCWWYFNGIKWIRYCN
jgi:hypothetical protein